MDALLLGRLLGPHPQGPANSRAGLIHLPRPQGEHLLQPTVSDHADFSRAAASPVQVLNGEILRALDEALADDSVQPERSATVSDFSAENVAEHILGFIDSVIGQFEVDDPMRAEKLEQARAGIEQGFREAREILDGLGVLNGDVAANIERTQALIQEGFERLAANAAPVTEASVTAPATETTQTPFQSASFSSRQTTSLVIDTADGDKITIEIDKQASASGTRYADGDGGVPVRGSEVSRGASVGFTFRVEGDLDDDEREAVEALIARVDKVSDKFFAGNMQAAFNKAARLEFDSEELAGFSLDMSSTRHFEAVSAYRKTMPVEQPGGSLEDVAAFGGELRNLLGEASGQRFSNPGKAVGDLFHQLVDERAGAQYHALKDEAFATLRGLVDAIIGQQKQAVDTEEVESEVDD